MKRIQVRIPGKSYAVFIGTGLLGRLPALLPPRFRPGRAVVVTDAWLARRLAPTVEKGFRRAGWRVDRVVAPRGERAKTWEEAGRILGRLVRFRADRETLLVALGGGSVGDAAGFAAAVHHRGIPWVQVPTTLLAQVDSGVGGKTAVNHALAKNAVGAFHQPEIVIADTETLSSLPDRDFRSGLAEAVKCALVFDPGFAAWLDRSWERILTRGSRELSRVVSTSVAWKACAVAADERDATGVRAVLNFGHTAGHALEAAEGFRLRHGEAVAWGMRVALALSEARGGVPRAAERAVAWRLLDRLRPPRPRGEVSPGRLLSWMSRDKKALGGRIGFILLRRLGRAYQDDVTRAELAAAFHRSGLSGKTRRRGAETQRSRFSV